MSGGPSRIPPVLETPRLRLRPLTLDDLDAMHSITGRADAMAHYVDLKDKSSGWPRERTERFLREISRSWNEKGYGRWGVELKNRAGAPLIGYCGLQDTDYLPDVMPAVELSIRLHPDLWGIELGPESGIAAVNWAFQTLDLDSILANTVEENVQSRRALAKVHFRLEAAVPYVSAESGRRAMFMVHRMTREEWASREHPYSALGKRWTIGSQVRTGLEGLPPLSGVSLRRSPVPVAGAVTQQRDQLADLMEHYESTAPTVVPRRSYTVLRLEGRNFTGYTEDLERPFDKKLTADLDAVAAVLAAEIDGARLAYVHTDEITLVLTDFEAGASRWCSGNAQRMASLAASMASAELNLRRRHASSRPALFDARVLPVPSLDEVEQYLIWRQREAVRESVRLAGEEYLGPDRIRGLTADAIRGLLFAEAGINWNDYADPLKRGRVVYPQALAGALAGKHDKVATPAEGGAAWRTTAAPHFGPFGWLRRLVPDRPPRRPEDITG